MRNGRCAGEILHAKHAFMPNSLGYCGPDDRGKILDHLHSQRTSDDLVSILKRFDAAYPFVKLIAKSTGMKPFDYRVAEAYWVGNSLLDDVPPVDFFEFAHQSLGGRVKREEAKTLFKEFGAIAKPHHTFYVLGLYSRTTPSVDNKEKLLQLMDSCRISWGRVLEIGERKLVVERSAIKFNKNHIELGRPQRTKVTYDKEIPPFGDITPGDWVSLHWNFASEKLTRNQLRNIRSYTMRDLFATNSFADKVNGLDS